MFNFLKKKKNQITDIDLMFLKQVIKQLHPKYSFLYPQISKDFLLGKKPNELGDEFTYSLLRNGNIESNFLNNDLPYFFIIKDIRIWNIVLEKYIFIELYIISGILSGYKVESNIEQLDLHRIDTSNIKEKVNSNIDKEELDNIIGKVDKDILKLLNIHNTFKIEIEEGDFYVLKELGDGNYLAIDEKGGVYGLIHDPYEVELLYNNKDDFFNALATGVFIIDKYYSSKFDLN